MIATRLQQLAQSRSRLFSRRAALAAAALLLGGLLLVAAFDVRLGVPQAARLVALAAFVPGAVFLFRRLRNPATAQDTARLIEAAHPDLGQSIRTAAQIAPQLHASCPPIEAALVAQTEQRTARLPLDTELAPRRSLVPAAFAAGALALAWIAALCVSPDWRTAAIRALGFPATFTTVKAAAFTDALKTDEAVRVVATTSGRRTEQAAVHVRAEGGEWRALPMAAVGPQQFDTLLADLEKPLEFYVTSGDGRSPTVRVAVHVPPRVRSISARLEPPADLGQPPTAHAGGDVEGVEGTKVDLTVEFDRPVAEARAVFSDGTDAPFSMDGARARAGFTLSPGERTWHIAGRDPGGVEFRTPPNRMEGIVDKPPVVKLAEPRDELEVTPLHELLARVQARDDHGLAAVGIVLQVGTKEEKLLEKKFEAPDVRHAAEMATAFLEKHALTLNDSLLVQAYATDHKPRNGARAVSAMAAVDIREFKRLYVMRDAKACACEKLLEKMIVLQRRVYSDTTQLRELAASQEIPRSLVLPLMDREGEVDMHAHNLEEMLGEDLDPEARQMQEDVARIIEHLHAAGAGLRAIRLTDATTEENAALVAMLKLRRQMIYKRAKTQPNERMTDTKPKREEDEHPTLTQLAERIEAVAKEERELAAQPADEGSGAARIRQQEALAGDVGEVLNDLQDHPSATDTLQTRGAQTETLMHAATKSLAGTPAESAASLAASESALREFAAHLRLLDQPPEEKALTQLEKRAEEAAEQLAKTAKGASSKGTGQGGTGKEKSQQGKGGGTTGDSQDKSAALAEKPAKDGSENGKSGQGKDAASAEGEKPEDFAAKVAALAEKAVTLDDALRKWSAGEGEPTPTGKALGELATAQRTAQLGKDLHALAKDLAGSGRSGKETAKKGTEGEPNRSSAGESLAAQAEALARQQQAIAAAMRKERDALRQTRAQQLAELRRRVQEMSGDNFVGVPNPVHGAVEASMDAKNRIARAMAGGTGKNVLAELHASHDPELEKWASYIDGNINRLPLVWRALRSVDARLATILAELRRTAPVAMRESAVPDQYRRVVESYFRALSDDFGSEEEEAEMPAKR
ncbi:MAG: hypothetical protein ABMA01_08055 [Chthoniobacteraceae bacterium]